MAISSWAAQVMERESAESRENTQEEHDDLSAREGGGTITSLVHNLLRSLGQQETKEVGTCLVVHGTFPQSCAQHIHWPLHAQALLMLLDEDQEGREQFLEQLVNDSCDIDSLAKVLHGTIKKTPEVLHTPELASSIATQVATSASGAHFVALNYRSLSQPHARCDCLRELTKDDVFGPEECQVLLSYLGSVCPLSMKK